MYRRIALRLALASTLTACAAEPSFAVTPREPGVRAPLSAACDVLDETRCLLPWPSSTFTTLDPTSPTGVRVSLTLDSINAADTLGPWGDADGFSRVGTLVAGFSSPLDPASFAGPLGGAMRLFVATPGHPRYGREEPLRIETDEDRGAAPESVIMGDPLAILEPGTDYVVVVTDSLRARAGAPLAPARGARVALGLVAPASAQEAELAGYHAPTRALLDEVGIAPEQVLRVWDFSTRTTDDAAGPLVAMRDTAIAAVTSGDARVEIDEVRHPAGGAIETIVVGRLTGLPRWVDDDGFLVRGDDGAPEVIGQTEAPFRVVVPRGTGDYRIALYGHGAAGSVRDGAFDERLAESGIGKVNVEFAGWTEDTLVDNLVGVATHLAIGARALLGPLTQSAAHALAIERAIDGPIGDAISADMLGGEPNPSAGRRPGADFPIWVGGSLGGTMGLVISSLDDRIAHGVLNVPGAAWAQWVPDSLFFGIFAASLRNVNGGRVNVALLAAMSQLLFDLVDGASFTHLAEDDVFLVQESIGDEVLPNEGNEFVAIATRATMVGAALRPVHGLASANEVVGGSAITQFHVLGADAYEVHGFAADQETVAGRAAFEQIDEFLRSAWDDGAPRIVAPSLCPAMSCDFTR